MSNVIYRGRVVPADLMVAYRAAKRDRDRAHCLCDQHAFRGSHRAFAYATEEVAHIRRERALRKAIAACKPVATD